MCNFIVNCRLKYLNRTRGELETKKKKKKRSIDLSLIIVLFKQCNFS